MMCTLSLIGNSPNGTLSTYVSLRAFTLYYLTQSMNMYVSYTLGLSTYWPLLLYMLYCTIVFL